MVYRMGLLSLLFGKKAVVESNPIQQSGLKKEKQSTTMLHLKGKPDANGLFPSELVMLAVAEKFTILETNYPKYLTYTYEIINPLKTLKALQEKGFLEVGSSKESLSNLKLAELKDIATSLGVATSGKKAEIIERLCIVDEEKLSAFVKERMWKLSQKGQGVLKDNAYILYFLDKHSYNVTEVGVDIWTVNEEIVKNPQRPYRDIIYGQLNDAMNKAAIQFQTNPTSGSAVTHQYCECYRIMGLFVEEEGKSFINAADLYFQYLYKRINIHAGLQLLLNYKRFSYDKKFRETFIEQYYEEIQLYPYQKTDILRLLDEINVTGNDVRTALVTSFERTKDSGVMSVNEAADFIIMELSGDVDKSRDLAYKLAKKAVKKV